MDQPEIIVFTETSDSDKHHVFFHLGTLDLIWLHKVTYMYMHLKQNQENEEACLSGVGRVGGSSVGGGHDQGKQYTCVRMSL